MLLKVEVGGEQHGAHVAFYAWPPALPDLVVSAGGGVHLQSRLALEALMTLQAGVAPATVDILDVALQVLSTGVGLATLATDTGDVVTVLLVSPEPLLATKYFATL